VAVLQNDKVEIIANDQVRSGPKWLETLLLAQDIFVAYLSTCCLQQKLQLAPLQLCHIHYTVDLQHFRPTCGVVMVVA
jgi:hypothetical protein